MFKRNSDENLDEYNEGYSAKYDDDYIAPSEEYRKDGEPNPDENNAEHNEYYGIEDAQKFFGYMLKDSEKILWSDQKNSFIKESETDERKAKTANIISIIGLILAIVSIPIPLPVFYILMYVGFAAFLAGVCLKFKYCPVSRDSCYALTDKRVIMLYKREIYSIYYRDISSTDHELTRGDNFGNIKFVTTKFWFNNEKECTGRYPMQIGGIREPAKVKALLDELIRKENEPGKSKKNRII